MRVSKHGLKGALAAMVLGAVAAGAAHAAGHVRLVEAFVEPGFDRTQAIRIAPVNAAQRKDPLFHTLANQLVDALTAQGFKVVGGAESTRQVVTLEYAALGSGVGVQKESTVNDGAYRSVIVTGYDIGGGAGPKLLWQTMMDEYGVSTDVRTTIPALIQAGAPYYGVARTPRGMNIAAWCADGRARTGSLIPAVCSQHPDRPYDSERAAKFLSTTQSSQVSGSSGGASSGGGGGGGGGGG